MREEARLRDAFSWNVLLKRKKEENIWQTSSYLKK